jgi:electron transfer flavoprotein alpha subunit
MDLEYLQSLMSGAAGESFGAAEGGIAVVGETQAGRLTPLTMAVIGKARELGNALGAPVKGFLFGSELAEPAAHMIKYGADSVTLFEEPALAEFSVEPYVAALAGQIEAGKIELVLFGATSLAGEVAPRLAQRLGGPLFSRCVGLDLDVGTHALVATCPMLGGEYYEVRAGRPGAPQCATLEAGVFPIPYPDEYRQGEVAPAATGELPAGRVRRLGGLDERCGAPPLRAARKIVCAGRGLVDRAGVELARQTAALLGAQVAGTRGALDEGWVTPEQVIGVGGESVRPALYIGCGVSGAIQHVAGMQGAGFVVAINDDPEAEIFAYADLGVVGDAPATLQALNAALREQQE